MNAKLMEEYLPDSSMESGNKCPECELSLFATKKENGRLHCYKCGLDFVACVGCGELLDPDDPRGYTQCDECKVRICHDCGSEVKPPTYYQDDNNDKRVWEDTPATCTKCGREF